MKHSPERRALLRLAPLFAKTDGWLVAALLLAWVAALVPIWLPRLLPLVDLPNHLSAIAILHHLGDPRWNADHYYERALFPAPYAGHYLPVHSLAYLFSIETANKIYLTVYAAALPASVIVLGRRFHRSPWLSLLVFPLIFNDSLGWGFVSFSAGIPTVLFALAALLAVLDSPTRGRLVALLALTFLTYFMHFLTWLFFGVCALLICALYLRRPLRVLAAAAAMLPSVALAITNIRHSAEISAGPVFATGMKSFVAVFPTVTESLRELHLRLIMRFSDDHDQLVLIALSTSWILLATTSPPPAGAPEPSGARAFIPQMVFAVALLGYFELPFRTYKPIDWWYINPRMAAVAAVLGALLPRGPIKGKRRWFVIPALIASVLYSAGMQTRFREFNVRAAGFLHLMDRVPRGKNTLVLTYEQNLGPSLSKGLVFYLFNSYAVVLKGGHTPYQYDFGFPVRPRPGAKLPAPGWPNRPYEFRQATMGAQWDYVITFMEPGDGQLFGDFAGRVPLIGHDGDWRLYASKDVR